MYTPVGSFFFLMGFGAKTRVRKQVFPRESCVPTEDLINPVEPPEIFYEDISRSFHDEKTTAITTTTILYTRAMV